MIKRKIHLSAYQELKIKKLNEIIKLKESKLEVSQNRNEILNKISDALKDLTEEMGRD